MAKLPTDPQRIPFQFRPGVAGFPGWGGMMMDGDPGSVPPNRFRHARDVRFDSGIVYGRPGNEQILNLGGVPYFVGGFQIINPRSRLWLCTQGCFGASAAQTGTSLILYDPEFTPTSQVVSRYIGAADGTLHLAGLGGTALYAGFNSLLRVLPIVDFGSGATGFSEGSNQANLPLRDFAGFTISCMREFPEIATLFIGLKDNTTPTNGRIWSYDGLTFTQEYSGLLPVAFGRWRNRILAAQDGQIIWRDNTSATWTAVTLAGFQSAPGHNAMVEYRDKTWIASAKDRLYTYDGTILADAHTVIGADTVDLLGVMGVAVVKDVLYYLWNTITTFGMKVGKYDPESTGFLWTDTYKDLVAQNANWTRGRGFLAHRGILYATRPMETLIGSPFNLIPGTWVAARDGGAGTGFPVTSLFVF